MDDMCCKNCKFRHYLKYMALRDGFRKIWEYASICTMLIETEGGADAFAMYVEDWDKCECFTRIEVE